MFNLLIKNRLFRFTFLISFLFIAQSVQATTITWIGGTGGDWFKDGNWDVGVVPNFGDEVIIPSGEAIIADDNANCQNIQISPGATLTIDKTGNLYVENEAVSEAILNQGTVASMGFISVLFTGSGNSTYGIENEGDFTQHGDMAISGFDHHAIKNVVGATLILTDRTILSECGGGLYNEGNVSQKGDLQIFEVEGTAISNYSPGKITNSGNIDITDIDIFGNAIIVNTGEFTNLKYAVIDIDDAISSAAGIQSTNSTAIFTNKGEIYLTFVDAPSALRINNNSTFINDTGSRVEIKNSSQIGLQVIGSGTFFENKGFLYVKSSTWDNINHDNGLFVNRRTGYIYSFYAGVYGLRIHPNAEFRNFGFTGIYYSSNNGLHINGQFTNKPKGYFFLNDRMACTGAATFLNEGHFDSFYTGLHSNSGGSITNEGAIGDRNDGFDGIITNNQSVRVAPFQGAVQVGVPVANALDLGTLNYVTVQSWTIAPSSNTSAGTYNSANNTFTPNANAVGLTTIYVSLKINTGGHTRKYSIPISGGVQPFKGGGGSSFSQTNNNGADENVSLRKGNSTAESNFNAYPNPVRDVLFVETENVPGTTSELVLLNSLGQQVLREMISSDTPKTSLAIPSALPNGTYVLSYRQNGIPIHSKRIVLTR